MMKKSNKLILSLVLSCLTLISFSAVSSATAIPTEIDYWVTPKVVHIKNDDLLKSYVALDYKENTKQVVHASKEQYRSIYDTDIAISDKSMGVEIIGHIFPDTVANYLPEWLASIIQNHTIVIDSGEASVDRDRWVWDSIAFVLGDWANIKKMEQRMTRQEIADSIYYKNKLRGNIRVDKNVMLKVIADIEENQVDPILLEVFT
ncbi:hypothetical protein I6N95_15715 [Vagococcus sp. BWB3-3]|uniref:Uncharacterized protein n=1 Tax=Vagococcus allomyrinae TaxID=2794353 RepID=A0A940PA80_9ENTE|nr:hypothetical protein [Vagococcus allomyrinae]MBP1042466.1 hypothetical protein [Vagococcus allomyrinae]